MGCSFSCSCSPSPPQEEKGLGDEEVRVCGCVKVCRNAAENVTESGDVGVRTATGIWNERILRIQFHN
jgi:hypothetical protein